MQKEQVPVVYLKPGECYIARQACRVETVLGSCVSVTLYCPITRMGAMNHAMLPEGCDSDRFVAVSLNRLLPPSGEYCRKGALPRALIQFLYP